MKPEESERDRGALVLLLVWAVSALLWLAPGITKPDGVGYFVYLPSIRFGGDLLFFDEWERFGLIEREVILHKEVTTTGHLGNHWTVGSSLLWFPAYLAGDAAAMLLSDRFGFPRNGISLPYNVPVVMTSALAGLATLILGYRAACKWVSPRPALIASLGIWFGSPLLWYSVRNPIMGHAAGAFACAVATVLAIRLRQSRAPVDLIAAGLAAGFAFAVRPQNAPIALLPLFFVPRVAWRDLRSLAGFGSGLLLGVLPQLVVSWTLYGTPWGFLTGGGNARPFAALEKIWTWEPIFSWYHGLLPWTPFLGLALVGFVFLWRLDRGLGAAAVYFFACQWLINALLERSFWGAYAFGQRRFDNCTIFFLLGAAALLARIPPVVGLLITIGCAAWTMSLAFASFNTLDLNIYYTPAEIISAQAAAVANLASFFQPLQSVPPAMKSVVLFLCALVALPTALACLVARWRYTGRLYFLTWAVSFYFLAMTAALAICGWRGMHAQPRYAQLVAFNRELASYMGGADARIGLLSDEAAFLRKSGRVEEALETEQLLETVLARRRQGVAAFRRKYEQGGTQR